jgi:hypothetical protein
MHSTRPGSLFTSRRHSSGPPLSALLFVALAAGAGGLGWFWLARDRIASEETTAAEDNPSVAAASAADLDALVVPGLPASDPFLRQVLTRVSAHPRWAAWLVNDDLARRFVKTVVDVARGSTPRAHVTFAAPTEPFSVEQSGGRTRVAAASYDRYDLFTEAMVSVDARAAAALYNKLHPLFEQAYTELGISEKTFDEMMSLAIANLLSVQVPERPAEVTLDETRYRFTDARLERLTPAEKHVLRLGPENATRFQAKVREVGEAIGISLP